MLVPALSLFGLPDGPAAVLDLTAGFAPLLISLWVICGLGLLSLAVAAAIHDPWWKNRQDKKTTDRPAPLPMYSMPLRPNMFRVHR